MSRRADSALSRADFHAATGVLLVVREPAFTNAVVPGQPATVPSNPAEGVEVLIAVWDDGTVTALHGHVDLGTGLRTALAQIVAEELDVPIDSINMVLGNTALAPNQGATIASASLQIHAEPLRRAAAQARAWLLAQVASEDGSFGAVLAGQPRPSGTRRRARRSRPDRRASPAPTCGTRRARWGWSPRWCSRTAGYCCKRGCRASPGASAPTH